MQSNALSLNALSLAAFALALAISLAAFALALSSLADISNYPPQCVTVTQQGSSVLCVRTNHTVRTLATITTTKE